MSRAVRSLINPNEAAAVRPATFRAASEMSRNRRKSPSMGRGATGTYVDVRRRLRT